MTHESDAREISLEAIELGEASVEAAERTLSACLTDRADGAAETIYDALRLWTWKALEARRRDSELADWGQLIATVAAHLQRRGSALAPKVETLAELIYPAIALGSAQSLIDLLRFKHVRRIMTLVATSGGRIRRRDLLEEASLGEANLTRVMGPLIDSGWFQREVEGREIHYRLTELGRDALSEVAGETVARPKVDRRQRISVLRKRDRDGMFHARASAHHRFGRLTTAQIESTGASNYGDGAGSGSPAKIESSAAAGKTGHPLYFLVEDRPDERKEQQYG